MNNIIERITLRNELLNQRRRLIGQYYRATGNIPNICNDNPNNDFEQFYRRRGEIGINLLQELDDRGMDVSSRSAVEVFRNIYDCIGIGNSRVIDYDTRLLRQEGANVIGDSDRYSIHCFRGNYDMNSIETIIMPSCERQIYRSVIYRRMNTFMLLNPHNLRERIFMHNMSIVNNNNIVIGYYGDIDDLDRERHLEEINNMSTRNNIEPITIERNNSYSYILTNRRQ